MRARWLPIVGLLLSVSAGAQPKPPQPPPPAPSVDCELFEVALSNKDKGEIDPALKPLEKKLSQPDFSGWNTKKLISRTTKTLQKNKNEDFGTKTGKTAIMLEDITKSQVLLKLQADDSKGKRKIGTTIKIEGADYFMTGWPEQNGIRLLLALTCKPSK